MHTQFQKFIESFKNEDNSVIIESIQKGFKACFENSVPPKKVPYINLPESVKNEIQEDYGIYNSYVIPNIPVNVEFIPSDDEDEPGNSDVVLTFVIWPKEAAKYIMGKLSQSEDADVRMADKGGMRVTIKYDKYTGTILKDLESL